MQCKHCKVSMVSGTSYRDKSDSKNRKRFHECPVCHFKQYTNGFNFQEILKREIQKSNRK